MSTLDDKLLGEKMHYYCSSSSEGESEDEDEKSPKSVEQEIDQTNGQIRQWDGTSCNTGPKGVIKDYQRFKQLERERKEDQKEELNRLTNKFSITCRTHAEDEKADKDLDEELAELMGDSCIQEFVQKRMQEMLETESRRIRFGSVQVLKDCDQFLAAVDQESSTCVLVLIHEPDRQGCISALKAVEVMAGDYVYYKFCTVRSSLISMSMNFKLGGVPALLAYKAGQLVGNFVRLTNDLGNEFDSEDLESYLIENGILNDKNLVPQLTSSADKDTQSDED